LATADVLQEHFDCAIQTMAKSMAEITSRHGKRSEWTSQVGELVETFAESGPLRAAFSAHQFERNSCPGEKLESLEV